MARNRKRKLRKFLEDHPFCCLCGGETEATTIEHAPPKVLFWQSIRPKGLEVPACERCNNGSSQADQVAALVACMQSPDSLRNGDRDEVKFKHIQKLIDGVGNNHAGLFKKTERSTLIQIEGLIREFPEVKINEDCFNKFLDPWAAKQALAIWYDHTQKIAPRDTRILVNWFSPRQLSQSRSFFNKLLQLPTVKRVSMGKKITDEQYFCRLRFTNDNAAAVFWIVLHRAQSVLISVDEDGRLFEGFEAPIKDHGAKLTTNGEYGIHQGNW